MAGAHDTRRSRTQDRGPPGSRAVIHTVEQIGPKREMLPNGSMLCRDVPIARTGWMMYGPNETPIPTATRPGAAPVAYVSRDEETLFAPECMGSFIGAAVTNGHPPVNVTPANWKTLSGGVVLEVRRGTGDDADCMVADLLITDKYLIEQINAGKREVSCGYEADYFITGDGEGKQANIIGNHLALVERGRCGPRCAIGDHDPLEEDDSMKTNTEGATRARIPLLESKRQRVADATRALEAAEAELEQSAGTDDDRAVHVHVHLTGDKAGETTPPPEGGKEGEAAAKAPTLDKAVEERFTKLEAGFSKVETLLAGIAEKIGTKDGAATGEKAGTGASGGKEGGEEGEEGERAQTGDSAALERSFKELVAEAEILVPGFKVPTFDAKLERKATVDAMCKCRRSALNAAHATADGAVLLQGITGSKDVDLEKMGCADVAVLFKAAAGAKRVLNNRSATGDSARVPQTQFGNLGPRPSMTPTEMNKRAEAFWKQQA